MTPPPPGFPQLQRQEGNPPSPLPQQIQQLAQIPKSPMPMQLFLDFDTGTSDDLSTTSISLDFDAGMSDDPLDFDVRRRDDPSSTRIPQFQYITYDYRATTALPSVHLRFRHQEGGRPLLLLDYLDFNAGRATPSPYTLDFDAGMSDDLFTTSITHDLRVTTAHPSVHPQFQRKEEG